MKSVPIRIFLRPILFFLATSLIYGIIANATYSSAFQTCMKDHTDECAAQPGYTFSATSAAIYPVNQLTVSFGGFEYENAGDPRD